MRGRNRGPFNRHPLAMLLGAIIVVVEVLTAIFVVGLGGVFHFLFSFLLPMALILLVVGTIGLAVQGGAKVLDSRDSPPSANVRNHPRGGTLSNPVYWLVMSLFLVASVAMACFFWLVIRDRWIHDRLLVAGRFDEGVASKKPERALKVQLEFPPLLSIVHPSSLASSLRSNPAPPTRACEQPKVRPCCPQWRDQRCRPPEKPR
jgi:hypothetical protein